MSTSAGHAYHLSRVWGSRHGGSAYSEALVDGLLKRGWTVTLFAEEFVDNQGATERVRLEVFFRRGFSVWLRRAREICGLWWRLATTPGALVIVQGDLPRLTYVLLQLLVPVVFVRQDGILTCPGNNRFLRRSRAVCGRRMGLSCLAVHRAERCMEGLPIWKQIGRLAFRTRDLFLLRCLRLFVTNSQYLAQAHGRPAFILYPPLVVQTPSWSTNDSGNPRFETRNPKQSIINETEQKVREIGAVGRNLRASAAKREVRDLGRLIFCGRLEEVKGAAEAIGIISLLPEKYYLEILGEGVERRRLGHLVEGLGLGHRVRFLSWVDGATRDLSLRAAGALLMPSLWDEAFGMAGREAFAQGTPVVAYQVGGVAEWCREGAGVLVRCGDIRRAARAVQELTADPLQWAVHSRAARQIAELDFPASRFARELNRLLAEI